MNDWVKPPFEPPYHDLWWKLFRDRSLAYHYNCATRLTNPNTISAKRMKKFTQACVIARLKGELK